MQVTWTSNSTSVRPRPLLHKSFQIHVPLIISPPTITIDWQPDKASWHKTQKIQINLYVLAWFIFLTLFSNDRYISNRRRGKSVDKIPITTRICSSLNPQN